MTIDIERLKHDLDYWLEVAPEGATHYGPGSRSWVAAWYAQDGEKWSYLGDKAVSESTATYEARNRKLIPRPSPTWNGEGLPPVGVECEGLVRYGGSERWRTVEVLKHSKGEAAVYVENGGCGFLAWCNTFRPLKTEKERVVEAVERQMRAEEDPQIIREIRMALEAAYDAGALKMPGGE